MTDNQKDNIHYMIMGMVMGVGIGYVIAMWMFYV